LISTPDPDFGGSSIANGRVEIDDLSRKNAFDPSHTLKMPVNL
jgi:hypothetical protein